MSIFASAGIFSGYATGGGTDSFLGYYATELALTTAYPTADAGDYAIVGATDTIWIWDTDTTAWVDSGDAPPALGVKDSGVVVDAATNELNFTGGVSATQTAAGKVDIDVTLAYSDLTKATRTVTADDDIETTDFIINCNHSSTITLTVLDTVTAITDKELIIKDIAGICASEPVVIESENTATFDGATQFVVNGNYDTIRLITDGTDWYSI